MRLTLSGTRGFQNDPLGFIANWITHCQSQFQDLLDTNLFTQQVREINALVFFGIK